jgi:hypothetical protein
MRTVTILRADITSGEVADVLSRALGPGYQVIPSSPTSRAGRALPAGADALLVRTSSSRLRRAQVNIVRQPDRTRIDVSPGGFVFAYPINSLGIARKVTGVLRQSAELRMPA